MLWLIGLWVSIVLGLVSCKGQVTVTSHSTTECTVRPIPRPARCRGGTTLTHTPPHAQTIIHCYQSGALSSSSMFMLSVMCPLWCLGGGVDLLDSDRTYVGSGKVYSHILQVNLAMKKRAIFYHLHNLARLLGSKLWNSSDCNLIAWSMLTAGYCWWCVLCSGVGGCWIYILNGQSFRHNTNVCTFNCGDGGLVVFLTMFPLYSFLLPKRMLQGLELS